ncbi:TPA: hypothetical protein I8637_004303 [Raoultella ornithinolytica]|uniref:hypothetical protein n=1 Tax=Raoultella ornithinolytica TaxID=54291 RepID=UPI001A2AD52A|nr:hypothetical protein [Raoultella ornithinolytica]ELF4973411.1 hypothetical protein [Raoultella planticola]ELH1431641.1 hypothetical protein [Raoultella ornithinolytica]HAT3824109.1 hypothetical protein [Raoultella ornithinolytica]HEQ2046487.1 hypothetical protein [Raoultella ornithinolytica]
MSDYELPAAGTVLTCIELRGCRVDSLTEGVTYPVIVSGAGDDGSPNVHPYTRLRMAPNLFTITGDDGAAVLLESLDSNIALFSAS